MEIWSGRLLQRRDRTSERVRRGAVGRTNRGAVLGQYNAISAASPISVSNSATLDLVGVSQMTHPVSDALTGSGGTVVNGLAGTSVILTTSASVGAATFSGAFQNGPGTLGLQAEGRCPHAGARRQQFLQRHNHGQRRRVGHQHINALSPNSAVTVSSGTLDVSGFANTIASLGVSGSGSLSLGLGNTLTSTGTAALAGTLTFSARAPWEIISCLPIRPNRIVRQHDGARPQLRPALQHQRHGVGRPDKAQIGAITVTAADPTVITGGTTSLRKRQQFRSGSSDGLKFTASASGRATECCTTAALRRPAAATHRL